jgi:hypothetical protein
MKQVDLSLLKDVQKFEMQKQLLVMAFCQEIVQVEASSSLPLNED